MSTLTDRLDQEETQAITDGHKSKDELLEEFIGVLLEQRHYTWAFLNYKKTVRDLMTLLEAGRAIEIGGGRHPLFDEDELRETGVRYAVNDVSAYELRLAPDYVDKLCFDIARPPGDPSRYPYGQTDVMFSHMVFEHVSDSRQAYRNIFDLLSEGGVCINFHPVLYAPPFVLNRILPEAVTGRALRHFFPNRSDNGHEPKFPARYDGCVVSERERRALLGIGFRKVWQVPFWHHAYFKSLPGLYQLDRALARMADRCDWNALASYCYTIVLK